MRLFGSLTRKCCHYMAPRERALRALEGACERPLGYAATRHPRYFPTRVVLAPTSYTIGNAIIASEPLATLRKESIMSMHADEVAYFTGRIEQSKALASATSSMSARASHEGIVRAYEQRLAALTGDTMPVESTTVGQPAVNQRRDGLAGDSA